jgi:hypothetical protein
VLEETAEFHDIDEDKDVYNPVDIDDGEDVDVDEAAADGDEHAPTELLDGLEDALGANPEVKKFESPLDEIDPFIFFAQACQALSQQEPQFFQQWTASIGQAGQQVLQAHMHQAEKHVKLIAEEKAEEAAEKEKERREKEERLAQRQAKRHQ